MDASGPVEQQLRELEERLLRPEVRKSADNIDALLAEDYVEIGSAGRVFDKHQVIESLQTESPVRRSLLDFKATLLAPGVVLTNYRAIRYGLSGEQPTYSLRSSIWTLVDGRWQMQFHQGTPSRETP
ncbi:MAG: DUF4440 domain-containing protein [Burkholderiales bacterium]